MSMLKGLAKTSVIVTAVCVILMIWGCGGRLGEPDEQAELPVTNVIDIKDRPVTATEPVKEAEPETSGPTVINEAAGSEETAADGESGITEVDDAAKEFYISEITDDIFDRIYGLSYKEDCTLPREDLRYLHVLHKDIDGNVLEGEMIVNVHIARDVLDVLKELYENDYPIEKIRLIDEYGADDEASMEDNNSSCFNYRTVPGSTKMSKHSMGLAIDINTRYNPYVRFKDGQSIITPLNGVEYADRDAVFDYKIEKGDICYNLFTEHGFSWGGEWKNSRDYQHFEIPDQRIAEWYR